MELEEKEFFVTERQGVISNDEDKGLIGELIFYRQSTVYTAPWAEPWDDDYKKVFEKNYEKGNCPFCCKKYLPLLTREHSPFEKISQICECGCHWVIVQPKEKTYPHKIIKVYNIMESITFGEWLERIQK